MRQLIALFLIAATLLGWLYSHADEGCACQQNCCCAMASAGEATSDSCPCGCEDKNTPHWESQPLAMVEMPEAILLSQTRTPIPPAIYCEPAFDLVPAECSLRQSVGTGPPGSSDSHLPSCFIGFYPPLRA